MWPDVPGMDHTPSGPQSPLPGTVLLSLSPSQLSAHPPHLRIRKNPPSSEGLLHLGLSHYSRPWLGTLRPKAIYDSCLLSCPHHHHLACGRCLKPISSHSLITTAWNPGLFSRFFKRVIMKNKESAVLFYSNSQEQHPKEYSLCPTPQSWLSASSPRQPASCLASFLTQLLPLGTWYLDPGWGPSAILAQTHPLDPSTLDNVYG